MNSPVMSFHSIEDNFSPKEMKGEVSAKQSGQASTIAPSSQSPDFDFIAGFLKELSRFRKSMITY